MPEDRIFRNALIVSVAFHFLIFYNWPLLKNLPALKTHDKIEVTYYSARKAPPVSDMVSQRQRLGRAALPSDAKIDQKKDGLAKSEARLKKEDIALPQPKLSQLHEKPITKIPEIEKDKPAKARFIKEITADGKMLISHQAKDLSNEPTYLNYYNSVWGKISKEANANKPRHFTEGKVRIVFIVARDGRLLRLNILAKESTKNMALINHALSSIERASPFPPFPAEMQEEHLTLRLTISFEKE